MSLNYSSGSGNGPFGLGWSLAIPRVTRKTEKGLPRYNHEDVFVLSGAEDLVLSDEQLSEVEQPDDYFVERYRPRTEGLFARIEQWTKASGDERGDVHWRIVTKDNATSIYGKSKSARIAHPLHPHRVYEWLLEETFDNKGNHLLHEYVQEDPFLAIDGVSEQNRSYTQTYLRRILYGNSPQSLPTERQVGHKRVGTHHLDPTDYLERHYVFELLFDYGDIDVLSNIPLASSSPAIAPIPQDWPIRDDASSTYRAGFEIRTLRRCQRVLMLHHFDELEGAPLVRSTDFRYENESRTRMSMLKEVQLTGYRKNGSDYLSRKLPPVEFGYSAFEPEKQHYQSVTAEGNDLPPRSLNDPEFSLIDLFGDGLPDVVQLTDDAFYYWRNLGNGKLDRRHVQHGPIPAVSSVQRSVAFGDTGGDGITDLIVKDAPLAGFYESTPSGRWQRFRKFESFPSVDLRDPNMRFVDLTGDGLSDMLVTRDQHFLWFQSLGEAGYAEPQHVARIHDLDEFPDIYFDDSTGRVRLADMTGDGLNDIVLIHDGRVDYWPNLGYGRFGKRVTMANCPRFPWDMDPGRIFLADLDGNGCADLVYVDFDHVDFWFNQTGNGWSEKESIGNTPVVSNTTTIQFSDFFGSGTASLIWSDDFQQQSGGNYKVLDFCGRQKPHLLIEMSNNMGATTRVRYATSTKFFLEDEKAGTPWATNLPFPVQVVEKSESIDHISNTKLVTSYKYHHGYFDGREREFRGFGRVDQYDSEEFITFSQSSLHGDIDVANSEAAYHVPPVLTKSWFHTGVYFDDDNISPSGEFYDHQDLVDAYRNEYYQGDPDAFVLDNHEVTHTDNPHEAFRVLRGAQMRTEVFSLDGTGKAYHPYVVTENAFRVSELQATGDNSHGVYLVTQRESISYNYERNPNDPRIGHDIVLAVDSYGQVTDSVAIGYPRRTPLASVPEQAEIKLVYTHVDLINKTDDSQFYNLGIPYQTRTFEVTGVDWSYDQGHLRAGVFAGITDTSDSPGVFRSFQWNRPANHVGLEKRLIEWSRSYFRSDASALEIDIALDADGHPTRTLRNRLPLGDIESLAIPYESFTAAHDDELLAEVFSDVGGITESMLLEGGYHREPDLAGYWWIPSGQQSFDPSQFLIAKTVRDPFGNNSFAEQDDYALFLLNTRDAVDNTTLAEIDYRFLQPNKVTDPNGNFAFAAFDTLGMVVGTAVQSKTGEGDTLDGFVPDLSDTQVLDYLAQPDAIAAQLLSGASTRLVYDIWAYHRGQMEVPSVIRPAVVSTIVREIHQSELGENETSPLQYSFLYSDGFGRELQIKAQAEPDRTTPDQPRWVGTGTVIYNNKGKAVKQFEPFFSDSHAFGIEQYGVSPTMFYDPVERVVCTVLQNHTYSKVVFDPWRQESWDVNDTIHSHQRWDPNTPDDLPPANYNPADDPDVGHFFSRLDALDYSPTWYQRRMDDALALQIWPNEARRNSEQDAAKKSARHAATPSIVHFDTLGRAVRTIADNGHEGQYESRVELDIEGNQQVVVDELDRIVMAYDVDIAGRQLKQISMEAGTRWMFVGVANNPIRAWGSRGHSFRTKYDPLRRPIASYMRKEGETILVGQTVYGETQPNPDVNNLRGQVVQVFDQAGVATSDEFDFKGNLLSSKRQLAKEYKSNLDWSGTVELETEAYTSRTRFDAMNRSTQQIAPHSDQPGTTINVIQPTYNEANLLEQVNAWLNQNVAPNNLLDPATANLNAVSGIDYDAKGQRTLIQYGNGVRTDYEYDPLTFRLEHLITRRNAVSFPDDCPDPHPSGWPGCQLQNLNYTFDPTGNITNIRDDAQQTIYFRNKRVEPSNEYRYDAIYRLVEATGREHLGQVGGSPIPHSSGDLDRIGLSHAGDSNAMGAYIESYVYDAVGNFMRQNKWGHA